MLVNLVNLLNLANLWICSVYTIVRINESKKQNYNVCICLACVTDNCKQDLDNFWDFYAYMQQQILNEQKYIDHP